MCRKFAIDFWSDTWLVDFILEVVSDQRDCRWASDIEGKSAQRAQETLYALVWFEMFLSFLLLNDSQEVKSFSVTETSFELKLFTLFTSFRISVNVECLDWVNFYYNYKSLYFILSRNHNIKKIKCYIAWMENQTSKGGMDGLGYLEEKL